jgi:hypothetical protein
MIIYLLSDLVTAFDVAEFQVGEPAITKLAIQCDPKKNLYILKVCLQLIYHDTCLKLIGLLVFQEAAFQNTSIPQIFVDFSTLYVLHRGRRGTVG